jgi:hypothetical protein
MAKSLILIEWPNSQECITCKHYCSIDDSRIGVDCGICVINSHKNQTGMCEDKVIDEPGLFDTPETDGK